MYCMKCGAEIAAEAKFCPKCGNQQNTVDRGIPSAKVPKNSPTSTNVSAADITGRNAGHLFARLGRLPKIALLAFVGLLALAFINGVVKGISGSSLKPADQIEFERKVADAHKKINEGGGTSTREGLEAHRSMSALLESLKSKQLENWVCKYDSATPREPLKGTGNSESFLNCVDVEKNVFHSKFDLRMPTSIGDQVGKVYLGDVIAFSGKPIYASGGAGLGYSLEVSVNEIKILKK